VAISNFHKIMKMKVFDILSIFRRRRRSWLYWGRIGSGNMERISNTFIFMILWKLDIATGGTARWYWDKNAFLFPVIP